MKYTPTPEPEQTFVLAPEPHGSTRTLTLVVVTAGRAPGIPIVTYHLSDESSFEAQLNAIEGAMDILRSLRERVGSAMIASCVLQGMDAEKEKKH